MAINEKGGLSVMDAVSEGWGQTSDIRWLTVLVYLINAVATTGISALAGLTSYRDLLSGHLFAPTHFDIVSSAVSLVSLLISAGTYFLLMRLAIFGTRAGLRGLDEAGRYFLIYCFKSVVLTVIALLPMGAVELIGLILPHAGLLRAAVLIIAIAIAIWLALRFIYAPIAATVRRDVSFRESFEKTRGLAFLTFVALVIPAIVFVICTFFGAGPVALLLGSLYSTRPDSPLGSLLIVFGPSFLLSASLSYILTIWQIGIFARIYRDIWGLEGSLHQEPAATDATIT